jgi:chemotaxis protein MotB
MAGKKAKKKMKTDGWLTTFGDMMALMLTFFVMLVSMASFEEAKLKDFFQAIGGSFGSAGASGAGVLIGGKTMSSEQQRLSEGRGVASPMNADVFMRSGAETPGTGATAKIAVSQQTKMEFEKTAMEIMQQQKGIEAQVTTQGLKIELQESFARFQSGVAQVPGDAVPKLKDLIQAKLKSFVDQGYEIMVIGHTDIVPLGPGAKAKFTDNRGLSTERANNVLRIFESVGVPPQQVSAAGYGEHVPKADNSTVEGKAENRRIEILVKFKEFSPGLQTSAAPAPAQ